jgi:hypothetical protein
MPARWYSPNIHEIKIHTGEQSVMPRNKVLQQQLEHLSTTQVRNIKRQLDSGKTQRQLAIKYGVKEQTIRLAADRAVNNGSII